MALSMGSVAPNFALFNTEKKEICLASFKGQKVVLVFFPLAFTGVCTTELCSLRDSLAAYNQVNAQVLGISIDSLFVLGEYEKELGVQFDLLSDFNKEVAQAYECLYDQFLFGMKGVSKRAVFVIDSNGILKHSEVLEDAGKLPDFEAVKTVLSQID